MKLTALIRGLHIANLLVRSAAQNFDQCVLFSSRSRHCLFHLSSQIVGSRQAQCHQQFFEVSTRFAFQLRFQLLGNSIANCCVSFESVSDLLTVSLASLKA